MIVLEFVYKGTTEGGIYGNLQVWQCLQYLMACGLRYGS